LPVLIATGLMNEFQLLSGQLKFTIQLDDWPWTSDGQFLDVDVIIKVPRGRSVRDKDRGGQMGGGGEGSGPRMFDLGDNSICSFPTKVSIHPEIAECGKYIRGSTTKPPPWTREFRGGAANGLQGRVVGRVPLKLEIYCVVICFHWLSGSDNQSGGSSTSTLGECSHGSPKICRSLKKFCRSYVQICSFCHKTSI